MSQVLLGHKTSKKGQLNFQVEVVDLLEVVPQWLLPPPILISTDKVAARGPGVPYSQLHSFKIPVIHWLTCKLGLLVCCKEFCFLPCTVQMQCIFISLKVSLSWFTVKLSLPSGVLACLDGYMNIALEQTEEYVNGQLKNKYGDAFIRGNNGNSSSLCYCSVKERYSTYEVWLRC